MIALDTTVLVYAVGTDHPLLEPSRSIVRAVGDGRLAATTTVEVIQEFAHVRARRRDRREASERAAEFAALLAPLLQPDAEDLRDGLDLFAAGPRLGAFDGVLAAVVARHERVTGLVSADRAFAEVTGLVHHDLAASDVLDTLGGLQP
ncbi:type II toxin-antitoxin system VapC family toxin [Iamia sp.]|uniref:type II toxin-antitoxin system VapC family toxin n=1 Tax=Iamia sp. TaxID=2722710 RepID=UPI002B7D3231|nr:type II toxin-antitoxin system VapC family toxin [Iamia sp.]HXH59221.1 type II toxin-antitoxin system VapC family toxin [Iamia sp.]